MMRPVKTIRLDPSRSSFWRSQSIERFSLVPVPEAWTDSVPVGTEEAWEKYDKHRILEEEGKKVVVISGKGEDGVSDDEIELEDNDSGEREDDLSADHGHLEDDEDGSKFFLSRWKEEMKETIELNMVGHCRWHWVPKFGDLEWDDSDELRSADYYSHVYSPFAIPRAISLKHLYHYRARFNVIEFQTAWAYHLVDFDDDATLDNVDESEFKVLCSGCYKDLQADFIETGHLDKVTVKKLRHFLYGSASKVSKEMTCSDKSFLLLLFGSMGTTDRRLEKDPYESFIGYCWYPGFGVDDPDGAGGYSWLYHRVMEITDTLTPVAENYVPPTPPADPEERMMQREQDRVVDFLYRFMHAMGQQMSREEIVDRYRQLEEGESG